MERQLAVPLAGRHKLELLQRERLEAQESAGLDQHERIELRPPAFV